MSLVTVLANLFWFRRVKWIKPALELFIVQLRISDQMLGGIETPRLNVTRVPLRSSPEA